MKKKWLRNLQSQLASKITSFKWLLFHLYYHYLSFLSSCFFFECQFIKLPTNLNKCSGLTKITFFLFGKWHDLILHVWGQDGKDISKLWKMDTHLGNNIFYLINIQKDVINITFQHENLNEWNYNSIIRYCYTLLCIYKYEFTIQCYLFPAFIPYWWMIKTFH